MSKYFGIDLSAWNIITDYAALLNSAYKGMKISFAFLRAGYYDKLDNRFMEHYNGLSGKIPLGVYVYSYARTVAEAKREAAWVLDKIKGLKIEYPVVLDYEDLALFSPKLTRKEYTAICKAFMDEIRAAGYSAMLYANPSFLEYYADKSALAVYPLWLAHYVADGKQRDFGQKVWQFGTFSPSGTIGAVDANFAYEDLRSAKTSYTLTAKIPTDKRAAVATALGSCGITNYTFK